LSDDGNRLGRCDGFHWSVTLLWTRMTWLPLWHSVVTSQANFDCHVNY